MTASRSDLAKSKLQGIVDAGIGKMQAGLEAMQREYQMREDFIVKPSALTVQVEKDGTVRPVFERKSAQAPVDLTPFSKTQFLARAGIPQVFAENVATKYHSPDVLQRLIGDLLPKVSKDGILFRVVGDQAKGVLSPSYKRTDTAPVFETFAKASIAAGLVPHGGLVTDTRGFLSFIIPEVIEVGGDYTIVGAQVKSSDYGNGAYDIEGYLMRLLCLNGMVGMSFLRKVHIGKRFTDQAMVSQLSKATMDLDTRTLQSATRDVVKALPASLRALTQVVKESSERSINLDAELAKLTRKGVKKEVQEKVKSLWETELPVEAVPEEKTAWRFSNILSLIAKEKSGDESKDLESIAFDVLN